MDNSMLKSMLLDCTDVGTSFIHKVQLKIELRSFNVGISVRCVAVNTSTDKCGNAKTPLRKCSASPVQSQFSIRRAQLGGEIPNLPPRGVSQPPLAVCRAQTKQGQVPAVPQTAGAGLAAFISVSQHFPSCQLPESLCCRSRWGSGAGGSTRQ